MITSCVEAATSHRINEKPDPWPERVAVFKVQRKRFCRPPQAVFRGVASDQAGKGHGSPIYP